MLRNIEVYWYVLCILPFILENECRSSSIVSICGRVDDVLLSTPSSSSTLMASTGSTLLQQDNVADKPDLLQLIVDEEEIKQFF